MRVLLSCLSILFATVALAQPTGPPTGPANCASAKTLACLAGRAGTANDLHISTDTNGDGTIYGATGSTGTLTLRGSTASTGIVEFNTGHVRFKYIGGGNIIPARFYDSGGTKYISLAPPMTMSGSAVDYTLPETPTANGQPLLSTIAGVMSWVSDTPSDGEQLTWHTGGSVTWDNSGTVDCTNSTLLCLTGRTNTDNDFIISTSGSQGGSIRGSSVNSAPLKLNAGSSSLPGGTIFSSTHTDLISSDGNFAPVTIPANFRVDSNGVVSTTGASYYVFSAGLDPLITTNYTTTIEPGSEFFSRLLADKRAFTMEPGGYSIIDGTCGGGGTCTMDEYGAVAAEAVFSAPNSTFWGGRKWNIFMDHSTFGQSGTGKMFVLPEYYSFRAQPIFGAGVFLDNGMTWRAFGVTPSIGAGTGVSVVGMHFQYDADAVQTIAIDNLSSGGISNANAANRFLLSTATAPSVHAGTFRIGSTTNTAAVQPLEVVGNIKLDNNGATAPELRLDEPSGDDYTGFKTAARTGSEVYTLPTDTPADGDALTWHTGDLLSWDTSGGGANCTTGSTLLCLAGRTGSTNDPIISTDSDGIITGSAGTDTKQLKLRGNSNTTRANAGDEITLADNVTTLNTSTGLWNVLEFAPNLTWSSTNIVNVFDVSEHKIWTINADQGVGGIGGVRGLVYAPIVRAGIDFDNSPTSNNMGHYWGVEFVPLFEADTAKNAYVAQVTGFYDGTNTCADTSFPCTHGGTSTVTIEGWNSHWLNGGPDTNVTIAKLVGLRNTADNTRGTITELNTIEDQPTIGSGRTLPTRRGLYFRDKVSTGTQTTAVAVDVADQTVGTLTAALRSAMVTGTGKWHLYLTGTAPSLFGGAIVGSEAADGTLTLKSTANADMGSIVLGDVPSDDTETALTWAPTAGDSTNLVAKPITFLQFNPTFTNDQSLGLTAIGLNCTGTSTNTAASVSVGNCVYANWTLAATVGGLPTGSTITDLTIYNQAAAATTANEHQVNIAPTYKTTGGVSSTITEANLYRSAPIISAAATNTQIVTDLTHVRVVDASKAAAGGTETITRQNGIWLPAMTSGTDNFPIRLTEAAASTITTVPASAAIITATTGAPNRITFINENEQRFDAGLVTWTGSTNGVLSTTAEQWFPANGRLAPDTTRGNHDSAAPGALTVVYMACAVSAAPNSGGGTQSRTFTLEEGTGDTAVACTISETDTDCTWCQTGTAGCDATGTAEAVASGAMLTIDATVSGTVTAGDASCTIWWTLNAF